MPQQENDTPDKPIPWEIARRDLLAERPAFFKEEAYPRLLESIRRHPDCLAKRYLLALSQVMVDEVFAESVTYFGLSDIALPCRPLPHKVVDLAAKEWIKKAWPQSLPSDAPALTEHDEDNLVSRRSFMAQTVGLLTGVGTAVVIGNLTSTRQPTAPVEPWWRTLIRKGAGATAGGALTLAGVEMMRNMNTDAIVEVTLQLLNPVLENELRLSLQNNAHGR